jgi:hypothetical protein
MSTSKPRITITLEPRVHEVLRRLSVANGQSMSSIVTEFLDVAVPPMERMVVVLEKANAMPDHLKGKLRDSFHKAEAKILPAAAAAVEQHDMFLNVALEAIQQAESDAVDRAPEARPKRGRGQGSTPVPVTRGLGSTKTGKTVIGKGVRNGRV